MMIIMMNKRTITMMMMMKMKMMKMKMMTPKVNEILTTFYIGVLLPSVYRFIAG